MGDVINIMVVVPSLEEKGPIIVSNNIIFGIGDKCKFTIVSLRNNKENLVKKMIEKGIEVIELGMNKLPTLKTYFLLKSNIININPDIIHVHSYWPTILVSKIKVSKPKISTLHNNPIEDFVFEYGRFIGKIMTFTFIKALKKYSTSVAISNYVKEKHRILGLQNDIKVVYNGIEDKRDELINNQNNTEEVKGNINIVSIGVLNKRKNIGMAIDVINGLLKSNKYKINFKIIGDGPERTNIETKIAQLNLCNHVELIGTLPREEVFEYINKSDVLLFTSLSEGLGLVALEFLMMGKIIVCSELEVFHEFIINRSNGYICENIEQYVNAIEEIYADEKLFLSIKREARRTFLNLFTRKIMAEGYFSIYQDLLKSGIK